MELAFETVALRRVCELDLEARKHYPERTVDDLQARLADLHAATSAADLVIARPWMDARPPAYIRFDLDGGYELWCVSNHPKPPLTVEGLVDFARVRRVRVTMIELRQRS